MTELVWDGKYKDGKKQGPVRIALPFQTVETVNESAQDRRRNLELFVSGRDTEWRNRLVWGDKKYVLPSLLPEFAGKVNLIYIDPPFATGADFSFSINIPDHSNGPDDETTHFRKEPSVLEQKAYRDTWGRGLDSYLQWMYATLTLLRELLSENGSIYVHCDSGVDSYIRAILDEVLGAENFRNELTWKRRVGMSSSVHESNRFGICTDTIFFYAASDDTLLVPQYNVNTPEYQEYIAAKFTLVDENGRRFQADNLGNPAPRPNLMYEYKGYKPPKNGWAISRAKMEEWDREGRLYFPKDPEGRIRRKRYVDELKGMPVQNLWTDIAEVNSQAEERIGYPTQKPEALLQRILKASSHEGELVLDCFCGSGTTAVVAENLNRRWIACDLSRFAIHTTRKRLLGIANVRPFAVQNLGKYERQAWQVAEFPANGKNHLEEQCQREAAYRSFILDLYHSKPVTGYVWLHGMRAGRMVHVAAVDAPVTQADVKAIGREAWKAIGSSKDAPTKAGADILGWEFALEVNELAKQVAAESRVDVSFKKIPREVLDKKAVEQGDVKFFELGALSVDLKQKKQTVTLKVTDFVIPTDDIPEEARKAIKHWSQLVDYWAVDWDFKDDTFHNQWQAYRTRKDPKIELATNYEYKEQGKYQIVVKVIDILGNDTTKTLEITVN
jgi:adenine-specific DNA-methyltransferase